MLSTYRPISLLISFSKIPEKMMCGRLTKFLNVNHIINHDQHLIQRNQNTISAISCFWESVVTPLDDVELVLDCCVICLKHFIVLITVFYWTIYSFTELKGQHMTDFLLIEIIVDRLWRYGEMIMYFWLRSSIKLYRQWDVVFHKVVHSLQSYVCCTQIIWRTYIVNSFFSQMILA